MRKPGDVFGTSFTSVPFLLVAPRADGCSAAGKGTKDMWERKTGR